MVEAISENIYNGGKTFQSKMFLTHLISEIELYVEKIERGKETVKKITVQLKRLKCLNKFFEHVFLTLCLFSTMLFLSWTCQ